METFLDGAIAMAFAVAGLFFLRFWRDTRDRLFLIFAIAFWVLAAARVGLLVAGDAAEGERKFYFYVLRLIAYLLILYSILEKNRFFKMSNHSQPTDSGDSGTGGT
jgi:hypothetical protein